MCISLLRYVTAFLLMFWSLTASAQTHKWVFVDGQFRLLPVTASTVQLDKAEAKIATPNKPKDAVALTKAGAATLLLGEIAKTAAWYTEGARAAEARSKAKEIAKSALAVGNNSFAIVPYTTRDPFRLPTETSPVVQIHTYDIRPPLISDDIHELRKAVFGPIQAELSPDHDGMPGQRGYLSGVAVAVKGPNGIDVRLMDQQDEKEYLIEESKRLEKIEAERRQKAERARKEAEEKEAKLAEEARKNREEEYAKEQKRREDQVKEAAERERHLRESRDAIEKRYKERDEACKAGRTTACAYIDDQLTNDIDKVQKYNVTARCMMDSEGGAPLTGPCAKDAPLCMYCRAGQQLSRQVRYESFAALQAQTRAELIQKGAIPISGLDQLVKAKLVNPAISERFGLQEFLIPKP
jgi:hypothetical protein